MTVGFLYQVLGKKEVENAALREQLADLQKEIAAIRQELQSRPRPMPP